MRVVGITGLPRSGKDTFAKSLLKYGYRRLAFADPLKDAAAAAYGLPRYKFEDEYKDVIDPYWDMTPRDMLKQLGTGAVRATNPYHWIQRLDKDLQGHRENPLLMGIVITDVRNINELEYVRKLGGFIVQVRRPGLMATTHETDQQLPLDPVRDLTIENTSANLGDYHSQIHRFFCHYADKFGLTTATA